MWTNFLSDGVFVHIPTVNLILYAKNTNYKPDPLYVKNYEYDTLYLLLLYENYR